MADNDSDFGNFLAGFVIGGLVGSAVALLLAPQSGEETRAVIRDKGIELKDRANETAEEARARAEQALEEARIRAEEAMDDVRARADELAQMTRDRANELQQRGQVLLDEQKARLNKAVETGKEAARRTREEVASGQKDQESESGDLPAQPPATPPPATPPVVPPAPPTEPEI
jgi:gas vesicle protein